MKRWISFAIVFVFGTAALVYCQKRQVESEAGPQAVVYFIADTEHELTRLPVAFTRLSDTDEINIGDELAKDYSERFGLSKEQDADTKAIQTYVQKVGGRVASGAKRKLPYKFHYIPDAGFINAFALPGGHVFIGKGLISLMTSEDELAAVLGHEVEHIDHYHCAERVQTEAALRKIPLGGILEIPVEVFEVGYSKDQELEADREGAVLAANEGYSMQGALDMFETFERLYRENVRKAATPEEEFSRVTIQALEDYFRSHPATQERIAQIRDLIASNPQWASTQVRKLEIGYIFDTERAGRTLAAGQFQIAAGLVAQVLKENPKYVPALRVQAEAQLALRNYPAAGDAYRALLELDPAAGQQVTTFANKLAAAALDRNDPRLASELATHWLELQVNEPGAMKILVGASILLGDDAAATATFRRIQNLYVSESSALLRQLEEGADADFARGKFEEAVRLTTGTLALNPLDWIAIQTRAKAQFALGHFSEAARDERSLIDAKLKNKNAVDTPLSVLITNYSDALGSGEEAHRGWSEFGQFAPALRLQGPDIANEADVELAGLALLDGNSAPTRELLSRAKNQTTEAIAPEALARLGWWYYRAHDSDGAQNLLAEITRLRPGDEELRNYQGWTALETQSSLIALSNFQQVPSDAQPDALLENGPQMGMVLATWRNGKREAALSAFEAAVNSKPQWLNAKWVGSIYSPGVAKTVGEMAGEYRQRQSARRQPSN